MVTCLQVKVKGFLKEMQDMTENHASDTPEMNPGFENPRIPRIVLGIFVSLETVVVAAGALYFLSRIFLESPKNIAGALVIFAITLLIAVGLAITAYATFVGSLWTRGVIITWQILQFALATSFIQGIETWQPLGWFLGVVSVTVFLLVILEIIKSPKLES
jgi:hypothetical protein